MILPDELKKIAKLKGHKSMGNAEKDYLLDIVLLSISKNTKDELIFKGGTCLYKFYKLNRFSEDIDFTLKKELNIDSLIKKIIIDMASFGVDANTKINKKIFNTVTAVIRAKGPLYQGSPQSYASVRIDINLKSSISTEPLLANYTSLYPDIPSFSLLLMQEKEILAEKTRAIISRNKARDVYDFWFLLKKGTEFDLKLVKEKLEYYKQKWDIKDFRKKLGIKEKIWKTELGPLITIVPDFKEVKKYILAEVSKK